MKTSNQKTLNQINVALRATARPALYLVHSAPVEQKKSNLNQGQRESIAEQCLTHDASRWNVARQFGVHIREVFEICDRAMYERGFRAGRNAERFQPSDSPRTQRRAA